MLSQTQKEILEAIQKGLVRGDIGKIAKKTKHSTVWVSNVLSVNTEAYNQKIVDEAVSLIEKRKQDTKKAFKKLQAA